MKLEIQRYSVPKGLTDKIYSLREDPSGEWVRFSEVEKLLVQAAAIGTLASSPIPSSYPNRLKCYKKIEISGTGGIAVNYCMKVNGHEGECKA